MLEPQRLPVSWRAEAWQLCRTPILPAAANVAFDEVLLDEFAAGRRSCVLRLWNWAAPTVVLGRFQTTSNEVDVPAAVAAGFQLVRRSSGGGAMLARPGEVFGYSMIFPAPLVAGLTIVESYAACDAWCVAAVRGMGVAARHEPINDIACPAGKIGGAAQVRRGGAILHHTLLALRFDNDLMRRVLRLGRPRREPRGTPSADKQVAPLCDLTGQTPEFLAARLAAEAAEAFAAAAAPPTPAELAAAAELGEDPRWRTETTATV